MYGPYEESSERSYFPFEDRFTVADSSNGSVVQGMIGKPINNSKMFPAWTLNVWAFNGIQRTVIVADSSNGIGCLGYDWETNQ